jgi:hypothetical protein
MQVAGSVDSRFDAYALAVGRIAIGWANLEFVINQAIWELANVEAAAGACMTAQIISIGPRMNALTSLVDFRNGGADILKSLNKLAGDIDGLARQRNRFIHDYVALKENTGEFQRVEVTARRKVVFDYQKVDLAEMEKLQSKIVKATQAFDELYARINSEVSPWPRTQYHGSSIGVQSHRGKLPRSK